jgi:hypothetical protein
MTRKEIIEILRASGVNVPVEQEFDLSGIEKPEIVREFIRLTGGDWKKSIYISKNGGPRDLWHYDLLFAIHESGRPVCIPVPIARKIFNNFSPCKVVGTIPVIPGDLYERIYAAYYKRRSEGTQDDLPF